MCRHLFSISETILIGHIVLLAFILAFTPTFKIVPAGNVLAPLDSLIQSFS